MVGSSDDEIRNESLERLRSVVEVAGQVGAKKAVAHVDASEELLLSEVGHFDELCSTVDALATVAQGENIELCVENMRASQRRRLTPRDTKK